LNKKIIIVAGTIAAGKTTFALRLSKELNVPIFSKDLFKTAVSRSLPVSDRAVSKRLSAATFDAIEFVTERFMETGNPLIIEANFVMSENHGGIREGDALKNLIARYGYGSLTFLFMGDAHVLHERFIERDKSPERGQANQAWEPMPYETFESVVSPLGDFDIGGEMIKVDTTNFETVDFERYLGIARGFLAGEVKP